MPQPSDPAPAERSKDSTLEYHTPARISSLANVAFYLGIASIPLVCVGGVGIPLGLIAFISGVVAEHAIKNSPQQLGGRGYAATGVCTGLIAAVGGILIVVLLPSSSNHGLAPRSTCAANLRGIAQSMIMYAGDNNNFYPYLGSQTIVAKPATANAPGCLMFDMYYLVGTGGVSPKQFQCKDDKSVVPSSAPMPSSSGPLPYTPTYWNNAGSMSQPKGGDMCYSYSIAFQYAAMDKLAEYWKNSMDAAVVIGGDMNPGRLNTLPIKNSMTHQGDGQNLAYADGHAQWSPTPAAGEDHDNVFTIADKSPSSNGQVGGLPFPPPSGNTKGTFDTCLVPSLANPSRQRQ